ncbi:MAG: biotin/lipoyl-binding protein, partial [Calditrichota bacterium]
MRDKKMKPKLRNIIVPLILLGVTIALILPKFHFFQTEAKGTSANQQQVSETPVESYIVQPELLKQRVESSGTILANEQVDLKSEVSGKITDIHFKEGSQVSKGDLLLKINDAELQAQLLKLQQQESLAKEQEYRQRQLLKKQAISQESYDQTLNQLQNLRADIALLHAQIAKTEI